MKIFLKMLEIPKTNSYTYTDCDPDVSGFCSKINTENSSDIAYILRLKRDKNRVKMPIYIGNNQEFKDWIEKIK